jgi:Tfp pilus assembly protein PilV
MKHDRNNGFALLEVLVGIGLAGLFFSGLVGLTLIANRSSGEAVTRQHATWAAQEGLSALRTVSFSELSNTQTGSVNFSGSQWQLGTNGPQSLGDGLQRTIRIEGVRRDGTCEVVESGGDVDPDSKYVVSEVQWADLTGRTQTVAFDTLRTNRENPQGDCFAPAAGSIDFDFSLSSWHGGKQLRDLFLTNEGNFNITVEKVRVSWDNTIEIEQLFMDQKKIWSKSGPGSPTGTQPSGTLLDVQDTDIGPGMTVEIPKVQFLDQMEGSVLTVELHFSDGSIFTSQEFSP